MGLAITTNGKGKYRLTSTVTDKRIHKSLWISEEEAKRMLIGEHLLNFIEKALEIDMDFPINWRIDGKFVDGEQKHLKHIMKHKSSYEFYQKTFNELSDKYELNCIFFDVSTTQKK